MEQLQHKLFILIKSTIVFVVLAIFIFALTSSQSSTHRTTEAADYRIELSDTTEEVLTDFVALKTATPSEPIKPRDIRAIQLENYLRRQGSYLARYTDLIVQQSDYYGVNPRLIVAIAGAESGYCRVNFRPNNCWGYGRYSWSSPEAAIRGYMSLMNKGYFSRGARTIEAIASPYNPTPEAYTKKVYTHYNQMPAM